MVEKEDQRIENSIKRYKTEKHSIIPADKEDEEDDEEYDDGSLKEAILVVNWNESSFERSKHNKQELVEFIEMQGGVPVKHSPNIFVFGSEDAIFHCLEGLKKKFVWLTEPDAKYFAPVIISAPRAGHFEYAVV
jgi:hypothetical protein